MRLDGLGRPPLIQPEGPDRAKVERLKIKSVSKAARTSGLEASVSGENEEGKLDKILDLLKRAQERKKKNQTKKAALLAIRAYQRASELESDESQVGQTLDVKV